MKKDKKNQYEQIEEYMRQGLSAVEAILKVKADHPELIPLAEYTFENAVFANFQMGSDKMTAVRKAASEHPELYQSWQKRLASGIDGALKDLFSAEPVAATVDKKPEAKAEQNADKKLDAALARANVSRVASEKPEKIYVSPWRQRKGTLDFF
jgi:hypothetical protein